MADDRTQYQELCRFMELFQGRFTEREAAVILQNKNGLQQAVNWVFSSESSEIRQMLDEDANTWTTVKRKIKSLKNEHNSGQARTSVLDRARSGIVNTEARLFACGPCDNFWWQRVPTRKKVSRCNRCRVRYDAVPREEEWGWAEFHCAHCHKEFGGWCAMYMQSPCFGCGQLVYPTRIVPPKERQNRSRKSIHVCAAPDCPGRYRYRGVITQTNSSMTCVHPSSRIMLGLPKVITPSTVHDSTGSTVDTYLSQTDLCKPQDQYFESLPTISEGDRADDYEGESNK